MTSVPSAAGLIHLGMDTSVNEIVVAVLRPGEEVPVVDRIPGDEESVRRLIGRFPDRRLLSACYEAGPGGYELHRLLTSMGVACDVVAPSLIPKGSSDRVKTDKRDSVRLALTHRAGLLTPVRVPSPAEEAVRDLVRARGDLLDDRKRMQQRLNAMLLRHGRIWRGGKKWSYAHRAWVDRQVFDEPALAEAFALYRGGLEAREAELAAAGARLAAWAGREPLAGPVTRLGGYRGIAQLTGLTLAAEVVDWRRFASARAFMGFAGLIPTEYSSGSRTRRGHITKAGPEGVRTALIEAAWAYRYRPAIGATLRRRQAGLPPETLARSWKAQQRLHAKYAKMTARGKPPGVAVVAVARELAGFVWAEMTT
jgi:transposase